MVVEFVDWLAMPALDRRIVAPLPLDAAAKRLL
jgi:hypothetical protein